MKKIIIFLAVLCCTTMWADLSFCSSYSDELIKILPEQSDMVIKFSSTKNFYEYLSVTDKSFMGEPINGLNEIKEELGFNPFDLKELENSGVDISKPFGFAVSDFKIINNGDGSNDETPSMNVIFCLPVKDSSKVIKKIKEIVENNNPNAEFTQKGGIWSWNIDIDSSEPEDLEDDNLSEDEEADNAAAAGGGAGNSEDNTQALKDAAENLDTTDQSKNSDNSAGQSSNEEDDTTETLTFYMVSKNEYLIIGTNPKVDSKAFFENFGKQEKNLTNSPVFSNVAKKIDAANDIFFYTNLSQIFNSNPEITKYLSPDIPQSEDVKPKIDKPKINFNYLKDYQGFGVSADLKNSDLIADFVVNIDEKSQLLNMFKGVVAKRDLILGLKDTPLLLLGFAENIQSYWKLIQETLDKDSVDSIKKEFLTFKDSYGVDIEKDIIENLGNNFALGMYDGMSINMTNINTLVSIEIKETAKMNSVIEKLIAKLTPENQSMINKVQINGSQVYMIAAGPVQLYAGFIGNEFVITLGKPMFEKAMSAEVDNSFIKNFKDTKLTTSLKQDISIFYFNFKEALYAVKNFMPMLASDKENSGLKIFMMPEFYKIVEPFNYISAFSRINENAVIGRFLFKTNFNKPFFEGVKDINSQIEALQNSNKTTPQDTKKKK